MTIDRHDPDTTPALQDEFWGEQTEWTVSDRRPSGPRSGVGAAIGRWWSGVLGAGAGAGAGSGSGVQRVHGRASGETSSVPHQPDLYDEFGSVEHDDSVEPDAVDDGRAIEHEDAWTVEPEPAKRRPGVDPLLARFGGLAVVLTLAAPVVMGFTSGSDDQPTAVSSAVDAVPVDGVPFAQPVSPAAPDQRVAPTEAEPITPAAGATASDAGDGDANATASPAALDVDDAEALVTEPPCGDDYELAAGDYWIRIADAADVDLADLLAVNGASVDTVLVPGRSICLPIGASTPAPPATVVPTTVAASSGGSSTSGGTAASAPQSTTRPVTTTAPAPTTTVPARPAAVSAAEAVAIIRAIWPDDLEERAIAIAWRESNHRSNVNNWCCYGLFQIHWEAHRSWLASIGVTSVSQLYDPTINATAAYTLYQRAGGFGPWGG